MKYITYQNGKIVCWTDHLVSHLDMFETLIDIYDKPISAGFIRKDEDGCLECYGKSETLKLENSILDAHLMDIFLEEER